MGNKIFAALIVLVLVTACSPSEEELFNEGVILMENNKLPEALDYFERVIEINPANNTAFNTKGIVLFEQKKYDEAITAFSSSIQLDSNSYKPYLNRGNAYLEKKDFKDALRDYNEANRLDPSQKDVYYNRGLALLGLEEYEDAIFDFDAALQHNPDDALTLFNKAKAQLGNNDPVNAIETLIQTIDIDQNNGAAYYLLGITQLSALGQKEDGCANLKMALTLGFSEAKTWLDDFCNA